MEVFPKEPSCFFPDCHPTACEGFPALVLSLLLLWSCSVPPWCCVAWQGKWEAFHTDWAPISPLTTSHVNFQESTHTHTQKGSDINTDNLLNEPKAPVLQLHIQQGIEILFSCLHIRHLVHCYTLRAINKLVSTLYSFLLWFIICPWIQFDFSSDDLSISKSMLAASLLLQSMHPIQKPSLPVITRWPKKAKCWFSVSVF